MNTAIRAHRILAALVNYQKADEADAQLTDLSAGNLGELIGCYRNPGPQEDPIRIFADGLALLDRSGHSIVLRFVDIAEVSLPSGKESECLILKMRTGTQTQLPVRGQRGRFFDSMEMLRFLDRVMRDQGGVSTVGSPTN